MTRVFEEEYEKLKTKKAKSTSSTVGEETKYTDLLKGRFELSKIVRIERKYNPNSSTSLKTGDITSKTIGELIEKVIMM
jgi:hypothetical protein